MKIPSSSKKSALKLFAFCVIFSMLFMNSAPAIYANAPEEVATEEVTPVESVVLEDEIVPGAPLSDLAQEEPEEVTEPEVVVDEVVSKADEATSEVKVVEKELSVVAKDKAIVKTNSNTKSFGASGLIDSSGIYSVAPRELARVILISPANNSTINSLYPNFIWDSNQEISGLSGYELKLYRNGSDYMQFSINDAYQTNLAGIRLTTGNWQWKMRVVDHRGMKGPWSETWNFIIEKPTLKTPILVAPANNSLVGNSCPSFSWNPNQDSSFLSGFEVSLRGPLSVQIKITDPSQTTSNDICAFMMGINGDWQWKMRVIDSDGVKGPWSETWNFTIDTISPNAPVLYAPVNSFVTNDPNITLEWDYEDFGTIPSIKGVVVDSLYYDVYLDDSLLVSDLTEKQYPWVFSEGLHSWKVIARDSAGNESPWSETWQFTVDTTAPDAPTLISPANGFETEPADVAFTWTAVDDATEYELTVNGATHYTTDTNLTLNLPEGNYSWKVKAKDSFGRWSVDSSVWGLTLATEDVPQDDDQDNDDDADDQGTVAGVTDENTEENTINRGTTSSTTTTATTGTVAGTTAFGTGGGADDEATEEDENKDEEKDGTVLGADDQDDPNLKAEASSFWNSFKWLLTKWWFWLILIIIILFLWWILGKRRKDDDKKKPLDIDNTPIR